MKELSFNWRFGNYALEACPQALAHIQPDCQNETIEFVKYESDGKHKFTIGYFWYDEHEPCWEFKFVGGRFCEIENKDAARILAALKLAYSALTAWKEFANG